MSVILGAQPRPKAHVGANRVERRVKFRTSLGRGIGVQRRHRKREKHRMLDARREPSAKRLQAGRNLRELVRAGEV
ncbi:MAG TPA: hypothetical protein VM692_09130, partial [Gammaproteobacteria bacterium]|nr:hypothetical protein [Gammaproteobacteria bacterium]